MPREAIIHFSRWKNFTLSGAAAAMLIALLVGMGWDHLHSSRSFGLDVLICLLVFAAGSVLHLRHALDRSPQLIIFKGGVSFRRSKLIYVPWRDIRSCRGMGAQGYRAVFLLLNGELHVPHSTPLLLRPLWVLKKRLGGPAIGFQTSNLDVGHSEIKRLIEEWIEYERRSLGFGDKFDGRAGRM